MTNQRTGRQMIEDLRRTRPDVAIEVTRVEDYVPWDGDGPNPEDEGFVCYTWDVTAKCIADGRTIEGMSSLGASWYRPEDTTSDDVREIGGYLPQMIDEAIEEMDAARKEAETEKAHD